MFLMLVRDDARVTQMLLVELAQMVLLHLRVNLAYVELGRILVDVRVLHLLVEDWDLFRLGNIRLVNQVCWLELVLNGLAVFGHKGSLRGC